MNSPLLCLRFASVRAKQVPLAPSTLLFHVDELVLDPSLFEISLCLLRVITFLRTKYLYVHIGLILSFVCIIKKIPQEQSQIFTIAFTLIILMIKFHSCTQLFRHVLDDVLFHRSQISKLTLCRSTNSINILPFHSKNINQFFQI